MQPRPYQRKAVDLIGAALAEYGSTLLVAATGTGKTVMLAHAIKDHCPPDKRAIVLAHRYELITQNAKTIGKVLGEPCDIERAEQHADTNQFHKARVIVASKDSLHPKRIARFEPSEFGLVVVDECHHATADSYTRVRDHFAGVPLMGVTATPDRADEEALGQVFASTAMVYDIADAIDDGWLVPVTAHTVTVQDLNIADIHTTGGDLNQGELAEQLERERPVHEVAASIMRECDDRRALVFTVSVRQAEKLAQVLNDYKAGCASWVCGETPHDQRRAIIAAHQQGETQFLVNVGVLTEGYDDPGVSMIVIARPTKSRSLFAQMVGRGTRPFPGTVDDDALHTPQLRREAIAASVKPNLRVVDFTGNCGRHKLVTPADVLGGKFSDDDRELASKMIASGEEPDVQAALRKAQKQHQDDGTEEEIRLYSSARKRITAQAAYLLSPNDLFGGSFSVGRERNWSTGQRPTEAQAQTLMRHGFKGEDVELMDRRECSRIIGEIVMRKQRGLCTLKQANYMKRRGIKNPHLISFERAGEIIGQLNSGQRVYA